MNCANYVVDRERALYIADLLKSVTDLIDYLEENDPQYDAVKNIVRNIGPGLGTVAVIGNAIISYQLTSRGETYWSMYGKWIVEKTPKNIKELKEIHKEFLLKTRYNFYSVKNKIKRLEKFYESSLANELVVDPFKYCSRIDSLVQVLSEIFHTDPSSKTMVFAGKMYYYICKSESKQVRGEIDLPVDRRNSLLTITSCIVKSCDKDLKKCVEELMKPNCRKLVISAWRIISKASSIPLYKLDSLTWLITGILKNNNYDPIRSFTYICESIGYCRNELKELLMALTMCKVN